MPWPVANHDRSVGSLLEASHQTKNGVQGIGLAFSILCLCAVA